MGGTQPGLTWKQSRVSRGSCTFPIIKSSTVRLLLWLLRARYVHGLCTDYARGYARIMHGRLLLSVSWTLVDCQTPFPLGARPDPTAILGHVCCSHVRMLCVCVHRRQTVAPTAPRRRLTTPMALWRSRCPPAPAREKHAAVSMCTRCGLVREGV